jgi:hypothetical protein
MVGSGAPSVIAEHAGEIRFAVEGALDIGPLLKGQSTRERATDVFSEMRIWDTEYNNGVLIYMSLADRTVEIVPIAGFTQRWARRSGRGPAAGWKPTSKRRTLKGAWSATFRR